MSNFVPFNTPAGVVWIQIEVGDDGQAQVTSLQGQAFDTFEETAAALSSNAQFLRDTLADLGPTGIEITFGIKAGIVPGIALGTSTPQFALAIGEEDANYTIKVKWEDKKDES